MSTTNQQTLAESGASYRPLNLEKGSYVPWASQFLRFLDNKKEEGELMRHSIDKGPYKRKDNPDPNNDCNTRVMNYILQGIPNDIYNSVDAFPDAKTMWARIKRGYTRRCLEDKLTNAMMLMARVITQCYSTPTNNRLRTSSNTRNQAVIQDGCVDIQSKNVGYAGNEYDHNVERIPRTESTPGKTNVQCYNCNGKGHYACECPNPSVRDANYFREQMLLATKDEARMHLDEEENDFMLDNAYGYNTLKKLNAAVIMMARIQPTDNKSDAKLTFDAEFISEVHASQIDMINGLLSKSDHEQSHHEKLETIIHTSVDDQIDYDIIFDDQFTDNDGGHAEHDTNAHDQSLHDFETLINNVQVDAEKNAK
ncbi:retrovirus-related pol polyprotein from transposon TNT 1-94 [Tanacetum coccineum]